MKIYRGIIMPGGARRIEVEDSRVGSFATFLLDSRADLANHSPDGFEWGYAGSGPAQTALALLADALDDDDIALLWHQYFKFAIVAHLAREAEWVMSQSVIVALVN